MLTKETTRQRNARIRAEYAADLGDYWAQSASHSVLNDFRSGNFVTIAAGRK